MSSSRQPLIEFFFPDSQDFVDPSYDFEHETRSSTRRRHCDDLYAHEVFSEAPYDGLVVSKAIVDGTEDHSPKYSASQKHRLRREGVRAFFRLDERASSRRLKTLGDCGAPSYVRLPEPPFSVDEVIDFYADCGFDVALSVDHAILGYDPDHDRRRRSRDVPVDWRRRQRISIELADEFRRKAGQRDVAFVPVGVAQGWSPGSYVNAVRQLQSMGYRYVAIGGLASLRARDVLACLEAIASVRRPDTRLHLLGLAKVDQVARYAKFGVASIDSASPLRRAFKDRKHNYFTLAGTFTAVRVPMVQGTVELHRALRTGRVAHSQAVRLERWCLDLLARYDQGGTTVEPVLEALCEYERLCWGEEGPIDDYRRTLSARPWKECPCAVCRAIGIHVVLLRGSERSRRRGFHNLHVLYERLQTELSGGVLRQSHPLIATPEVQMRSPSELRLPALEIRQGPGRVLYSFAAEGKHVAGFAAVSRIRQDAANGVMGYQRGEILSHIAEIRKYIESKDAMIPNAMVIAFDHRVRFEPLAGAVEVASVRHGTIVIPMSKAQKEGEQPGWIVDGQQRAAAIREAKVSSFPVCIVAFITDDPKEQREQFILVNSTRPLPKGLIYELLPGTDTRLPTLFERRRAPAYLLQRLNHDVDSPLKGMIRTATNPQGKVKDNSLLRMIENSEADGLMRRIRKSAAGGRAEEELLAVLKTFWNAMRVVFEDAWGRSPRQSRLMHGAGVVSMGYIMDAIAERYRLDGIPTQQQFQEDLEPLREYCCWTEGYWDLRPPRKWNEVQNTPKDTELLSNYLLLVYKTRVWHRAGEGRRVAAK